MSVVCELKKHLLISCVIWWTLETKYCTAYLLNQSPPSPGSARCFWEQGKEQHKGILPRPSAGQEPVSLLCLAIIDSKRGVRARACEEWRGEGSLKLSFSINHLLLLLSIALGIRTSPALLTSRFLWSSITFP